MTKTNLPAWLDPDGLAHPEALNTIRDQARVLEQDALELVEHAKRVYRRLVVLSDATYLATNPYSVSNDAPEVPSDVVDAVMAAVGIERVSRLVSWLTDTNGFDGGPIDDSYRRQLDDEFGERVDWDMDCRQAARSLVGLPAAG